MTKYVIGATVIVAETFEADDDSKTELRKGYRGIIDEVDADGDLAVDFIDVSYPQVNWVYQEKLGKLKILGDQGEAADEEKRVSMDDAKVAQCGANLEGFVAIASVDEAKSQTMSQEKSQAIKTMAAAILGGDASKMKLSLTNAARLKLTGALCRRCQLVHKSAERAEVAAFGERVFAMSAKLTSSMPKDVHYVLVSSPEHALDGHAVLAKASKMVEILGGTNKAGDAKDWFHTMMMTDNEMDKMIRGWRIAWKSRVCAFLVDLKRFFPSHDIVMITIDGGPECQWELEQLRGEIMNAYPCYRLKRCADLAAFEEYFVDGAPLP